MQVRDLKFTLSEETTTSQSDTILFPCIRDERAQVSFVHPSTFESDFLLQTFIDKVDPFLKILHKPTLRLDLNHFRRGILQEPIGFQCRLFAVYALALLPMCSMLIKHRFVESKKALLAQYRSYVSRG